LLVNLRNGLTAGTTIAKTPLQLPYNSPPLSFFVAFAVPM
jgi:hypothetical protein